MLRVFKFIIAFIVFFLVFALSFVFVGLYKESKNWERIRQYDNDILGV